MLFHQTIEQSFVGCLSTCCSVMIGNLKHHHADVAKRIVGSVAVDEHHLTDGQLLARAESSTVLHSSHRRGEGRRIDKCCEHFGDATEIAHFTTISAA